MPARPVSNARPSLRCAGERQFQFHPVVRQLRGAAAALAALQPAQVVARHGAERARQVGLLAAGEVDEFVQRGGRLLGDDAEQVAVAGEQHVGEGYSVEMNQTFGSLGETRCSPRAIRSVRDFIAS